MYVCMYCWTKLMQRFPSKFMNPFRWLWPSSTLTHKNIPFPSRLILFHCHIFVLLLLLLLTNCAILSSTSINYSSKISSKFYKIFSKNNSVWSSNPATTKQKKTYQDLKGSYNSLHFNIVRNIIMSRDSIFKFCNT